MNDHLPDAASFNTTSSLRNHVEASVMNEPVWLLMLYTPEVNPMRSGCGWLEKSVIHMGLREESGRGFHVPLNARVLAGVSNRCRMLQSEERIVWWVLFGGIRQGLSGIRRPG